MPIFRTVFQLSRSIGQIIVFHKGVPLVSALVVGNLCEYRHKLLKTRIVVIRSLSQSLGLYSTVLT